MRTRELWGGATVLCILGAAFAACVGDDPKGGSPGADASPVDSSTVTGNDTGAPQPDGATTPDSATAPDAGDAAAQDASNDALPDVKDAAADVTYTYSDPTVAARWEAHSLPGAPPFAGGAFDGRHIYMVPSTDGTTRFSTVYRYDTQGAFTGGGWATFDLTTAAGGASARGYYGSAFDGRYLYLVPSGHGLVARLDTRAAGGFTTASNWSFLDISSAHGTNFSSAVFDGKYVYLLPGAASGFRVARIDTTGAFTAGSVESFQTVDVNSNAYAFDGGTFDGTYLYLTIYKSSAPCPLLRYEVAKPFRQPSSWSSFDTSVLGACGMRGSAFDGRYSYFVPHYGPSGFNGKMLRYDTRAAFTARTSYLVYDLQSINGNLRSFAGAVFDGRNIHVIPQGDSPSGLVAVYDTTLPFDTASSWKQYDVTALDVNAKSFLGGVFDGRHLYMVPVANRVVVRFDAKSPAGLPPGFGASFF